MDNMSLTLTADEFKSFYGIDRSLYLVLVKSLLRNPLECLYVMGLWMCLERGLSPGFISRILALPEFLVYELADEALACLKCLNPGFPFSSELFEIPLTCKLLDKALNLRTLYENRTTAFNQVKNLVNQILLPAVSDIIEGYRSRQSSFPVPIPGHGLPGSYRNLMSHRSSINSLGHNNFSSMDVSRNILSQPYSLRAHEATRADRTMFVTFSKGYPVTKAEVTHFFTRIFGSCIESFHMQEVRPLEQSLYAKIVFVKETIIRAILDGQLKAKFTINGKHVWLRRFVPRDNKPACYGCGGVDACTCMFG